MDHPSNLLPYKPCLGLPSRQLSKGSYWKSKQILVTFMGVKINRQWPCRHTLLSGRLTVPIILGKRNKKIVSFRHPSVIKAFSPVLGDRPLLADLKRKDCEITSQIGSWCWMTGHVFPAWENDTSQRCAKTWIVSGSYFLSNCCLYKRSAWATLNRLSSDGRRQSIDGSNEVKAVFLKCVCLGFFDSELLICISKLQIKLCDERTLQIMWGENCICFLCMDVSQRCLKKVLLFFLRCCF